MHSQNREGMILTQGWTLSRTRSKRASVIPYTIINGKLHFLLGIDAQTGDITDLGGGVKKDERSLEACFRELTEETLGSLRCIVSSSNDFMLCPCAKTKTMCCIFVYIPERYHLNVLDRFNKARRMATLLRKRVEIKGLVWVSVKKFIVYLDDRNTGMWDKIKPFYRSVMESGFVDSNLIRPSR